jgi:hypothetical protein
MVKGGLMQLVAHGAQDVYLTGNPQITFFKVVYKRHTNYAVEAIEQTFNGQVGFGNKVVCNLSRAGDLIHKMYLELDLKESSKSIDFNSINTELMKIGGVTATGSLAYTDVAGTSDATLNSLQMQNYINPRLSQYMRKLGHGIVDYIELEIGGQLIDRHYGEWMEIWCQLTNSGEQLKKVRLMGNSNLSQDGKLYVPLQFWFNRNPGAALPLVALQYHTVTVSLKFNTLANVKSEIHDYLYATNTGLSDVVSSGTITAGHERYVANVALFTGGSSICYSSGSSLETDMSISNAALFCDYIFLDTDERRRFAQNSHEYLIEQTQFNNGNGLAAGVNSINVPLNFNHPVKELVWVVQNDGNVGDLMFNYWRGNVPGSGTDSLGDQVSKAKIQLNGVDRMGERNGSYFRIVQPYQHHCNASMDACETQFGGFAGVNTTIPLWIPNNLSKTTTDGDAGINTLDVSITRKSLKLYSGSNDSGGIYLYSFALTPEELQPSGSCNFSRIDNSVLSLTLNASNDGAGSTVSRSVRIYAVNYNILRIMSGMGGLAYSN